MNNVFQYIRGEIKNQNKEEFKSLAINKWLYNSFDFYFSLIRLWDPFIRGKSPPLTVWEHRIWEMDLYFFISLLKMHSYLTFNSLIIYSIRRFPFANTQHMNFVNLPVLWHWHTHSCAYLWVQGSALRMSKKMFHNILIILASWKNHNQGHNRTTAIS